MFFLLNRKDLGFNTFVRVVREWPNKGRIWMILGEWVVTYNSKLAMQYLQKAIAVGYGTAEAYYYLGVAYEKTGDLTKARESLQTAVKINPDYVIANRLLKAIESSVAK
jgi:tetratricopeptide (TPR) repeat protein